MTCVRGNALATWADHIRSIVEGGRKEDHSDDRTNSRLRAGSGSVQKLYNTGACNDAETCLRVSRDRPRLKTFSRFALSVGFKVGAIFSARVPFPTSFFNVRIS